ncbi:putative nuclease HARBI1 [Sitophilus oryzae]|uniref:Putative nuclease HARBI1 n=1 Tax=Sitophilus oryzae TaxID=7048 RepID=A0A6J2YEI6_SITOR|nr:putative nuclease HARBI1 [Sitophilus oryzae]
MDHLWEDITDDEDFLELVHHVHPQAPQVYRDRPDHFNIWNDTEFKARFRLEKQVVRFIIDELSEQISSVTDRNQAVTPTEMVCTALRFLATGSFLQVVGDFGGIHKSTASRKIYMVLEAIAQLAQHFVRMPRTEAEVTNVRKGFFNIAKLPRCVGALDCTHVKIQSPGGIDAESYRNRKGFFSDNVQAICSSDLKFQDIVCRWPGSAHDSNIFRNSRVRNDFENGVYGDNLLVADSGYTIKPYVITPLLNPHTRAEHLFNEAQI